jgi:hypothetical protein
VDAGAGEVEVVSPREVGKVADEEGEGVEEWEEGASQPEAEAEEGPVKGDEETG